MGLSGHDRAALAGPTVMAHDYGDEVVVANLDTGWFFSFVGLHRELWCRLVEGYSVDEVRAALVPGSDAQAEALGEVLSVVAEQRLLAPAHISSPSSLPSPISISEGGLEAFDDLQNALLLDPVHEADDAGWPYADPRDA